eukprot:TRINITY_DN4926_c0_g1_i1.p1 TRINITY_DN4926_c0_g1~~TRINITY_DN4926_c0_g1_i1.p1  ORF type:complete len:705 (+),score=117.38 TRINITY_DN4926_c0_g1_i1:692-2806(+)
MGLTSDPELVCVGSVLVSFSVPDPPSLEPKDQKFDSVELAAPFCSFSVGIEALNAVRVLRVDSLEDILAVVETAFAFHSSSKGEEKVFLTRVTLGLSDLSAWRPIFHRSNGTVALSPPQIVAAPGEGGDVALLEQALAKLGGGAFRATADPDFVRQTMLAVSSSMANASRRAKPGHALPALSMLTDGGREVDPSDQTKPVPATASVAARKKLLAKVGQVVDVDDISLRSGRMLRFCLRENMELLLSLGNGLTADELASRFHDGSVTLSAEQVSRIQCAPPGRWFCGSCPASSDKGGGVLLVPMPGSIFRCPGKGCGELQAVPSDGLVFSCGFCPVTFGMGSVKASEVELHAAASLRTRSVEVTRLSYQYLRLFGGEAALDSHQGYLATQALLAQYMEDPSFSPFVYRHQKTARHLAFSLGWCCTMDGIGGLALQDFQVVDQPKGINLPMHNLADAIRKAETAPPPPWRFKTTDPVEVQNMYIEGAAVEALQDLVNLHGRNFQKDAELFMMHYREHTYDAVNVEDWSPYRRSVLLWACISDFSRRLRLQMSNDTSDQRYDHEKPHCIRVSFYLNSLLVLRHVEEPFEKSFKRQCLNELFKMPASLCADHTRPPRSRGHGEPNPSPHESAGLGAANIQIDDLAPARASELHLASSSIDHLAHALALSLIHISEPTRLLSISYAVFCLKKKKNTKISKNKSIKKSHT